MPRLFTALEVPAASALALSLVQGGLAGARWIDRENFHITLRFLGEVDGPTADELVDGLGELDGPPIAIAFSGLGAFGSGPPRSLHAAVDGGRPLESLVAAQERLMRAMGLSPETRRFHAHVTLARLRGASDAAVAAWLEGRPSLSVPSFTASRFVLMSSRGSRGGGPYAVEAAFPLTDHATGQDG